MALRVVFAGTPGFSVPCLRALLAADGIEVTGVLSQPDRRSGRGMRLNPSPVKQAALDAGLDVLTPEHLRGNTNALDWLQRQQPDFLVVVAFGMILPRDWLSAPRIAPVNVHASLLPRWRGAAPIERALLAGDNETGVCIMHMEEGLDTGGVYACVKTPITAATTGADLWAQLADMGADLLCDCLPKIARGAIKVNPQDEAKATYAAKVQNGDREIDWTQAAAQVDRVVRCFSPRPGARTRLDGRWLKILAGEVVEACVDAPAGSIVGEDFCVACGDGGLYRVLRVQAEGKKPMDAASFQCGRRMQPGEMLGERVAEGVTDVHG